MALKSFSSWHFKCTVSGVSSQVKAFQCSVLPNAPGLGSTHRISAPQRICCKCAPASQQRWAIPQTLADLTEENSYWQCLKKETTLCELCHSPPLPSLTEHDSVETEAKANHSTEGKINNLELTTTKGLQVIPFYHPRAPRILQGGLRRRNITVRMSNTHT